MILRLTTSCPVLSEELKQTLDIRSLEEKEINRALEEAYWAYRAEEARHSKFGVDKDGKVCVVVTTFPKELEAIDKRLWSKIDAVLDERRQAVARRHLPLEQVFPYGDKKATVRIWKDGLRYYTKEETQIGLLGKGHSSSTTPVLKNQYHRFWEEAHKRAAAAKPEPSLAAPKAGADESKDKKEGP